MPDYIVVLRMPASFCIPLGKRLQLDSGGRLLRYYSEAVSLAGEHVPRELVAEVACGAENLPQALEQSAASVLAASHVMSFIANAFVGSPEIDLGFDASPGASERDFFQRCLFPAPALGGIVPGRSLDPMTAGPFHSALAGHPDSIRLLTAINHYSLALTHWRPGSETLALASLWMGVENITGAALRAHLKSTGQTEGELEKDWGIKQRKALRPEVRRRLIFKGDSDAYSTALNASDGFEHGFLDPATVRAKARRTHATVATYLRETIIGLLSLDETVREQLVASKYQQPRGPLMVDNYFWGKLVGTGTKLAADGYSYPRLDWSTAVSKVLKNDDGGWSFQFSETMTVRCGADVQMKAERREVWDASLALDNATGTV